MNRIFEFGNNFIEAAGNKINNLKITENVGSVIGNITGGKYIGSVYEINGRRYTCLRLIAEGGFGFVYQVRDEYNQFYALKRMILQDKERLNAIKNEIDVMQRLKNNSNIVKLEGFKVNENYERRETEVLMLIELCQGGSVLDIMNERVNRKLEESEILAIFSDVCLGVLEMHSHNPPIAHRDLKIENILFSDSSNRYKICDFGSATTRTFNTKQDQERRRAEDDINLFTTLFYRSPEMVDLYRGDIINEKVDIWALGCLLFKMAYYADPFDGGSLQIINNKYQIPENSKYSERFNNLIKSLLITSPVERPTIFDICNQLQEFKGPNSKRQQFTPPIHNNNNNNSRTSSNNNSMTNSSNSTPSTNSPILNSSNGNGSYFDQSSLNRTSSSSSISSNNGGSRNSNTNNSPVVARNLFDLLDGKPPSNRSSPVPSRHNTNNLNNSGNNINFNNSSNSIPSSKANGFDDGFDDFDAWGTSFQQSPSTSLTNSSNSTNTTMNNSNKSVQLNNNNSTKKRLEDDFGDLFLNTTPNNSVNNSSSSIKTTNNINNSGGSLPFTPIQPQVKVNTTPSPSSSSSVLDFEWTTSTLAPTPINSQQPKPTNNSNINNNNQKFDFGDFEAFTPSNSYNNNNNNNFNNNQTKNSSFFNSPTSNISTPMNNSSNSNLFNNNTSSGGVSNLNSVLSPMNNNIGGGTIPVNNGGGMNNLNYSPSTSSPNQQRTNFNNTTNFSQNMNNTYKPNYNIDLNSYTHAPQPLPNTISQQNTQYSQQQKILNFDIFK